jgi:signal transduction histidine kinase
LTSYAFNPDRLAILELLAAQAAISLKNTRLYSDLQEREARYREAQMELSHANRVTTMGQLTASIAHEVSQPIAAAITSAYAALSWLGRHPLIWKRSGSPSMPSSKTAIEPAASSAGYAPCASNCNR